MSKNKEISEGRAKSQAVVYDGHLYQVPTDCLENLFLWVDDNFDDIPGGKRLKRIWWENHERIKAYWKDTFSAPEQVEEKRDTSYTREQNEDVIRKYPVFEDIIRKSMQGNPNQHDPKLFEELMKTLGKEEQKAPGHFGQDGKPRYTPEEESNVGAF